MIRPTRARKVLSSMPGFIKPRLAPLRRKTRSARLPQSGRPFTDNASVNEAVHRIARSTQETIRAHALPIKRGDFTMIALKAIALVAGAGILFAMYSGDLGADVVLAIIACLA